MAALLRELRTAEQRILSARDLIADELRYNAQVVAAAEVSPSSAEWPTGDGWIIQLGPKGVTNAAHDWEIPDSPLLPDAVMPKTIISVPAEFKFNITLTIRHNDKSLGNHGARARRPLGTTHCGDEAPHNLWPGHCRGLEHPRARR